MQRTAGKFLEFEETKRLRRPIHLNIKLTKSTDMEALLNVGKFSICLVTTKAMSLTTVSSFSLFISMFQQILECFDISNEERETFSFGIVGLHPCGDLAAILLNIFLNCKEAKFLNIVGCCHMKMTERYHKFA